MIEQTLTVEDATPQAVAPYGHYIGDHPGQPEFATWPGVVVFGPTPIKVGTGGEILHVRMAAASFPVRVQLLERHRKHTQTYLSANGRPFVMVVGRRTRGGLPDTSALRAFLFKNSSGIALHAATWHEFPLALEDDTRFTVILRSESHQNTLESPEHPWDARGPDLERYDMQERAKIFVAIS